jgi:hypothetical protein
LTPLSRLMYFFLQLFLKSHPVLDQTQATGAVLSGLYGKLYYTSGYPQPSVTVRRPYIVLLNSSYFLFLKML